MFDSSCLITLCAVSPHLIIRLLSHFLSLLTHLISFHYLSVALLFQYCPVSSCLTPLCLPIVSFCHSLSLLFYNSSSYYLSSHSVTLPFHYIPLIILPMSDSASLLLSCHSLTHCSLKPPSLPSSLSSPRNVTVALNYSSLLPHFHYPPVHFSD